MYRLIEKRTVLLHFCACLIVMAFLLLNESLASSKKIYKLFKVTYVRQSDYLNVKITTDLPDNTPLRITCTKTGLRDNDRWIGCDGVDSVVMGGIAEAKISIDGLPKGSYELEVIFNSFWISRPTTMEPSLQALIGEFGEHLQTPYIRNFEHSGAKYRMIDFKKVAFTISNKNKPVYSSGNAGSRQSTAPEKKSSSGDPSRNLFSSYGDVEKDYKACSDALTSAKILYGKSASAWEGASLISECMERKGYTWNINKNDWVKR